MKRPTGTHRLGKIHSKVWFAAILGQAAILFALGYMARGPGEVARTGHAGKYAAAGADQHPGEKGTIWTCSMHLQIRQPRPGKCPICGMDLIPASNLAGGGGTSLREISIPPEALAMMQVETTPVKRRYVTAKIRMVGKVDYDETRLGYITAWVPGRLDRLFVDYTGVEVRKGDHMAEMYSPELYAAQEELILASQTVKQRGRSVTNREHGTTLLDAAREKLRLWGMTLEQIRQIEQQDKPTDHMTIFAPMGGVVIYKNRQEGDYVKTGERIYTVADLNWVWVRLDAYESDLPWLHYGQKVIFTTEAHPGERYVGRIVFIDPVLDARTRTVKVRVNVENKGGGLKPEMFVRAEVQAMVATAGRVMDPELAGKWISPMHPEIIRDKPGKCPICGMPLVSAESLGYVPALADASLRPLVIPVSAALVTGTRAIVYVELPESEPPAFEGREIVLGPRAGDYYIVRRGLKEGELVVTSGNFKIDSALQLQAKPSMMTPEGAGGDSPLDKHGDHKSQATAHQLPHAFGQQLKALEAAYREVADAIRTDDIEEIHAAFNGLDTDLRRVKAERLTGRDTLVWKELAMLLGNDALEGREVARPQDAYRVFNTTARHMRRMSEVFSGRDNGDDREYHRLDVPESFQNQLTALWQAYRELTDSLATDNLPRARKSTVRLASALRHVDMKGLDPPAHQRWMQAFQGIERLLGDFKHADDLAATREIFASLSARMATVVQSFGVGGLPSIYRLHCPMAVDNRGADWLQSDDQVRNPYFGAKMLTCADRVELIAGAESTENKSANQPPGVPSP